MNIFIDARMTRIGGTYTYTSSLLEEILNQDSGNNEYYVLYKKGQKQILPERSNPIVSKVKNPLMWLLWDRTILPFILWKKKIDVYHTFKRPESLRTKAKKIITIHSAYTFIYPKLQSLGERLYWTRSLRKSAKNADAVLSVSQTDKDNLIRSLKLKPEKVFVHHLAVPKSILKSTAKEKKSQVKRKYNLPDKYLLFIGSFYFPKNIPNIIKAFGIFQENVSREHKLVLTGGDASASRDIYRTIKETGLDGDVICTGPVTDNISEIYSGADVFVFPTIYDSFGFPVLEAMNCGVPVLISNTGALPEVAGNAALQVDPFEIEQIAEGMERLVTDQNLRKQMIEKGYHRVTEFSWKKCAEETIKVYNDVVKERSQ